MIDMIEVCLMVEKVHKMSWYGQEVPRKLPQEKFDFGGFQKMSNYVLALSNLSQTLTLNGHELISTICR